MLFIVRIVLVSIGIDQDTAMAQSACGQDCALCNEISGECMQCLSGAVLVHVSASSSAVCYLLHASIFSIPNTSQPCNYNKSLL